MWVLAFRKRLIGFKFERRRKMAILKDKKVVIVGDRDGVPGPAIAACVETAGGEVVYMSTECFV